MQMEMLVFFAQYSCTNPKRKMSEPSPSTITTPQFEFTVSPRVYETDLQGHINNVAISGWFELGRVRFMEHVHEEAGVTSSNNWVIAALNIDFVRETQYGQDVVIRISEVKLGTSSVSIYCDICQAGEVTVRGKSVMVHRLAGEAKSSPIPDELRAALS